MGDFNTASTDGTSSVATQQNTTQQNSTTTSDLPAEARQQLSNDGQTTADGGSEQPDQRQTDGNADAGKTAQQQRQDTRQQDRQPSRSERRINELTGRLRDAERQRDHYRQLSESAGRVRQLDPLDFPSDAAYHAAVIQETVKGTQATFAKSQAEQASQEAARAGQELWAARVEDFKRTMPDFEAVVYSDNVPISRPMYDAIRSLETGPRIAYYLGKNPGEANRLSQMSPMEALIEIGRIDAKLAPPQPKRISTAPNPAPTVQGRTAATAARPDGDDFDSYMAWHDRKFGKG